MEPIEKRLTALEEKIDKIFKSVEKTRRYFLITLIVTILTIILPLIALAFVIPQYLDTITSGFTGQ